MKKIFVVISLLVLIGLIFYINEYVYQEKCPAKILNRNMSGEKEFYKGVYMPTLSASLLREDYRPYSSNLDKAAENGINTLAFGPMFYANDKGEVWLVPETKEFLISFIKKAQARGFKIWLIPEVMYPEPDLKQKFFRGGPGRIPDEILENTDLMQNLESAVIGWAKIAEELKIDIFSPLNEADVKLGMENRRKWLAEIKPKIEEVYSGKLCLKGEWDTSAFNNSYSCFAPTIEIPENEEEKNKLAITINNWAEDAKKRDLELIIGELWSGQGWKGRKETKRGYVMALEAIRGKVDGVFVLDGLSSRPILAPAPFAECVVREFFLQPELEQAGPLQIHNQNMSGEIKQDQIWSGGIYIMKGVTVAEGVTLAIEPGTTVRFEHGDGLNVRGVLMALGTADKPIRFTSDAAQPEHGDWTGIHLYPGSAGSVLDHVIVEYANPGIYVNDNITLSNSIVRWTTGCALPLYSTATITHNRIYQSGSGTIEVHYRTEPIITYNTLGGSTQGSGIRVEAYSHPVISHNIIRDNKISGIDITWSSSATVEYNLITGNGEGIAIGQMGSASKSVIRYNNIQDNKASNLLVGTPETLTATHNWWGATDEAVIESKMISGPGATIVYKPYETSVVDIGNITYDFENNETYEHLPKTEHDTFKYIFWEDDNTRTIVSSITPPGSAGPIAWDGEALYVAVADSPTDTIFKLDLLGNILDSFRSPATQTMGLAFDGHNLWVLDYTQGLVFQVSRSGKVIKSIPAPCNEPQGLTYDGQYFWTFTSQMHGKAYQFDTSGDTIRTLETNGFSGLAWDGKYLWINGGAELTQIDPLNGRVIRAITPSGVFPQYLVWQEPYLWVAEWADELPDHSRLIQMLPTKERITLDGLKDDWQESTPLLLDPEGDAVGEKTDIKAIHGFADGENLYLMLEFYELADYDYFFLEVDVNGNGYKDYDAGGFSPGHPERSIVLNDYILGKSRWIQYMTDYKGTELSSNAKDVFELKVPLWLFQNETNFYVRVLVSGQSYMIDATDWAHVGVSKI